MALAAKRAIDLVVGFAGLVVALPVMSVLALCIRVTMGSSIIFRDRRIGIHGREFDLLKFRTMREPALGECRSLSDAQRLTRLGRVLRRASLDELPQLWNVVKGEMSLVGPRPMPLRYVPYLRAGEMARMSVKPGITGLAQVSGRNTLSWDDRFALDVMYVESWSLALDLRILVRSIRVIVRADGYLWSPSSTMKNLDVERAAEFCR